MEAVNFKEIEDKKARRLAKTITIVYLLLFPVFFVFALASCMVFDKPNMNIPFGLMLIFLCFSIPLSMLFTLYLVWSRYTRGNYEQSRRLCWIPLYSLGALFVAGCIEGLFM